MTESPVSQDTSRRAAAPLQRDFQHTSPGYDSRGLIVAATAVLVIAFMAVGTWSSYQADFRNDQYQLLQLGQCVHGGDTLYVD